MDTRIIFYIIGNFLITLAAAMTIPAMVDLYAGHGDWISFVISAAITLFIGIMLILSNRSEQKGLSIRQAFLLTGLSWISLGFFAALPFFYSEIGLGFTDSVFEAVSGITTTGSTVISGLDDAPSGILLWRSILQWLGGIGIIVMAISVLPMLKVGGMQLFQTESSDNSEKILPRTAQLAGELLFLYTALTLLCAILYGLAGMEAFDAINHAMTTLATGGYSTKDASMGYFDPAIQWICITFMILGALPFMLYLRALHGDATPLLKDRQIHWFLIALLCIITVMAVYLFISSGNPAINEEGRQLSILDSLRLAAFSIVSVITTTGYANADYGLWGPFAIGVFFFVTFSGGCAGSTTGGIKIFRFQVLYGVTRNHILRLIHPHGIFVSYYNKRPGQEDVPLSVMTFFFLFFFSFAVMVLILKALGLDFLTAMSGAGTALANVGPGLGDIIGPSGNFAPLEDAAKWVLIAGMLLGRLELLTLMVLIAPQFWQR